MTIWAFLLIVSAVVYAYSWGALWLMLGHMPVRPDLAARLAKDWTTIGAFALSTPLLLLVVVGPIPVGIMSLVAGGVLLLTAGRLNRSDPDSGVRNGLKGFLLRWLAITGISVLLAYGVLWSMGLVFMAPVPEHAAP